jgi:hypothetical protein
LISVKPAFPSFSFMDLTAWNGVGEALTKFKKSFAAILVLTGAMVEYALEATCCDIASSRAVM